MNALPEWLAGTTRKDWLFDGRRCSQEQWDRLQWNGAWVDLGPSPAGNLGPYWHVPLRDGDTVHRLYPKLLSSKWALVAHQAANEFRAKLLDHETVNQ
jgi:hypothetical protein